MRRLRDKINIEDDDKVSIDALYSNIFKPLIDDILITAKNRNNKNNELCNLVLKFKGDLDNNIDKITTFDEFIELIYKSISKYNLLEYDYFKYLLYYYLEDKSDDIDFYFKNMVLQSENIYKKSYREYDSKNYDKNNSIEIDDVV